MTSFLQLACGINLGGDRGSVIFRTKHDPEPVTYPEYLILKVLHGGEDHVHSAMIVGRVERDSQTEYERLTKVYGEAALQAVFPGAQYMLPPGDENLFPSEEEVKAGDAAKAKAQAAAKAKRKPTLHLPDLVNSVPEMPA